MSILDVVKRARTEPPFAPSDWPLPDVRFVCKVLERVHWDRDDVEQKLGVEIHSDLALLWSVCGGLILYEDNQMRQSGLVVLSPSDVVATNHEYRKTKEDRVLRGDLVFAGFHGDLERALIRSDKTAADYGTVVIVTEMGPRSEWHTAARSLEEFLLGFMDARGEKYWEYHYQRMRVERAKELKD